MAITIATTTILGVSSMGANAEWKQNDNGTWIYDNNGNLLKNKWMYDKSSGKNYHFDANGTMQNNSWVNSDGKWYYVGSDGALVKNTTINGYQIDNDGVWISGNTTTNINSNNNTTNINNGIINNGGTNTSVIYNYFGQNNNTKNTNTNINPNNVSMPISIPLNWIKVGDNYAINSRSPLAFGVKDTFGVNEDDILLGIKESLILKTGYNAIEKSYNGYKSNGFEYLDVTDKGIEKYYYVVIFNNNKVYGFMMVGTQDNYNTDKQDLENVLNTSLKLN
jgi:hypothetical protein